MSKITYIRNKNKKELLSDTAADSFESETVLNFTGIFAKPCIKFQTVKIKGAHSYI